jgi:FkbM family methyltransferase
MNLGDVAERLLGPVNKTKLKYFIRNNKSSFYDIKTFEIMNKALAYNSTCIDIGCHKGSILRAMLKFAPGGRFFAFEPIPGLYKTLLNEFEDRESVRLYNIALSDRKETVDFNYVISNPGYSGILKRRYDRPHEQDITIVVQTDLLDNIIPCSEKIDFIKIDVEGAELKVLRGAKKVINASRPIVVFEHGVGGADVYGVRPEHLYDFLRDECDMKVSLLDNWLDNKGALPRSKFIDQFDNRINYYFIAYGHEIGRS